MSQDAIRRLRLADQVYELLRDRIGTRDLGPGDHLSVPVLAAELGLSRSPVREAVQRLVVEGFAVEELHRGARVADLSVDEWADLSAVRAVLEGLAARCAAEGESDADVIAGLRESVAAHARAIAAHDESAIIDADRAFHRRIAEAAGNAHLTRLLEPLWGRAQLAMLAGDLARWPRKALSEHRAILDAIADGDPVAAEAAARAHIDAVLARHRGRRADPRPRVDAAE